MNNFVTLIRQAISGLRGGNWLDALKAINQAVTLALDALTPEAPAMMYEGPIGFNTMPSAADHLEEALGDDQPASEEEMVAMLPLLLEAQKVALARAA